MATTSDIRNGMIIRFKDDLYEIIEFLHVKPGKGGAFVRTKLKNVRTGRVLENTFRTSEKLEEVRVEKHKKTYLYFDGDFYIFMDNNTFEQMHVPKEMLGDQSLFLV
ncbi:MAG: elongation factor P, partial [Candidatus Cloacimonetes bacterium]|nr:elongation factor P [Candidatus Cloacimonadota bacterium]